MNQTRTPDPRALFTRVVDDIVEQIRDGRLQPGQRVPSTRELADHYGVATMTAQRAMRELQVRGATNGVVGKGTFVRPDAVTRLTTPTASPDCRRCKDESSYTKHLVGIIGRCHQMADQLAAHPSCEVARIAADVRRLASMLAGGMMDHACHLDHHASRRRHDYHDKDDHCYYDYYEGDYS